MKRTAVIVVFVGLCAWPAWGQAPAPPLVVPPGGEVVVAIDGVTKSIPVVAPPPQPRIETSEGDAPPFSALPLWTRVRLVVEYSSQPLEAQASVAVRTRRGAYTRREATVPVAPIKGNSRQFSTGSFVLGTSQAPEPFGADLEAGDIIEVLYKGSEDGSRSRGWETYYVVAPDHRPKTVRIIPPAVQLAVTFDPGAISLRSDTDAAVEVELVQPSSRQSIEALIRLFGNRDSIVRPLTLVRQGSTATYRGVIDADMRRQLNVRPGRTLRAEYQDRFRDATIVEPPDSATLGTIRARVRGSSPQPVAIFRAMFLGTEVRPQELVASGMTPLDYAAPAGTYQVRIGGEPIRYARMVEVTAGRTIDVALDQPATGEVLVHIAGGDLGRIVPERLRVLPLAAGDARDTRDTWVPGDGVFGQERVVVPAGRYLIPITLPMRVGGGTVIETVDVAAGRTHVLRIDASARLKVLVRDAGGRLVRREVTIGRGVDAIAGESGDTFRLRPGSHRVSIRDTRAAFGAGALEVDVPPFSASGGHDTTVDVQLGRLQVPYEGPEADRNLWIEIDEQPIALGDALDVLPGLHIVEIGHRDGLDKGLPAEVYRVEVAAGQSVIVDRESTQARLRVAFPDDAVAAWDLTLEGVDGSVGRHSYRFTKRYGQWTGVGADLQGGPGTRVRLQHDVVSLPAGRYRLSLQASSSTNGVETIVRCDVVVTAIARQESPASCGPLGAIDVSVRNASGATRASIRLAKGPNQVTVSTGRAVSRAVFRVPHGNYTVRADGVGEQFVVVNGGKTTTVTITAPR